MKFKVYRASDVICQESAITKEFNTLEELIDFCKKSKHPVIINTNSYIFDDMTLEIYDSYIE